MSRLREWRLWRVPIEGTNWGGHELKLFLLLARCLLGFVVWYGCPVAAFGGFSALNSAAWLTEPPPTPPLPPTRPPPRSAGLKVVPIRTNRLKSPEI